LVAADPERLADEEEKMRQEPYLLDETARGSVLAVLVAHSAYREWTLLAAHVRTNHVHVIVEAEVPPEKVMNEFKSYASRELNRMGCDRLERRRWARHGSTRWLWKDQEVRDAIRYVIDEQGKPMAVFVAEGL
jgi:REP element-mobilizing transposase RayT